MNGNNKEDEKFPKYINNSLGNSLIGSAYKKSVEKYITEGSKEYVFKVWEMIPKELKDNLKDLSYGIEYNSHITIIEKYDELNAFNLFLIILAQIGDE